MSIFFPFYKKPKLRTFNYKPLYYDERKDAMKQRIERIKKEMEMQQNENAMEEKKDFEKSIRGSFRNNGPNGSTRDKLAKFNRTMMVVMIVLVVLIGIAYFVLSQWDKF